MAINDQAATLVALDVGEKRIGIAVSSVLTRLPRPLCTLTQNSKVLDELVKLLEEQQARAVIIGLPRNLNGEDTAQTAYVRRFGRALEAVVDIPVYWIDEALTTKQAQEEFRHRQVTPAKGELDALAACYILRDFLASSQGSTHNNEI